MFYKIVVGKNIVGIAQLPDLRKYQKKHGLVLLAKIVEAQFVESGGILYHDNWMQPIDSDCSVLFEQADVERIEEEEYNALAEAFETNSEIDVEEDATIDTQEGPAEKELDATVEFVRDAKIKQMSRVCESIITNGFDIELSDGNLHHFSLSANDQINMITLASQISSGTMLIPYHADGELCKYYAVSDAAAILEKATTLKTYHTTYYNSLKYYIESLDSIEDISAIQYGAEIPAGYQSDVYKQMAGEH